MLGQLFMIIGALLALISAGTLSYTYLNSSMGPRESTLVVQPALIVTPKKTAPVTTTSIPVVQKKVTVKTPVATSTKTTTTITTVVPKTVSATTAVLAPGPLRATTSVTTTTTNSGDLTMPGVIYYTNLARNQNGGLPALTENTTLDLDAQMKLNDMFAKQYFEHVSPTGVGPADLAKAVGYQYVLVGENLALGDFGSDSGVVTAWMNSPGHRANILNTHYQEIGVAVGKGMYEGHMTWLAVQSFGMPLSACPAIDANLKAQIDANNITIASLRSQLDTKKAQIDSTPMSDPNYNTYVNEFNAIVPQYNNLIEVNRQNVAAYNLGVQSFNTCIGSVSTSTTTH